MPRKDLTWNVSDKNTKYQMINTKGMKAMKRLYEQVFATWHLRITDRICVKPTLSYFAIFTEDKRCSG